MKKSNCRRTKQNIFCDQKKTKQTVHLQRKLIKKFKNAAIIQTRYYDKKYMSKNYRVENKILLNSKNITLNQFVKKLNYKFYDSFKIKKSIKKQFYKLKLFKNFRSIYNVFHVFLLKFYKNKKHCF